MIEHRGEDKQEITAFKRIAGMLDPNIPLYLLPGNHDTFTTTSSLENYRQTFGPDRYSFRYKGAYFIALNSELMLGQPQEHAEEKAQLQWLEAELKKTAIERPLQIIVFMHRPLFLSDPIEEDNYFNVPLEARKTYFALFREYGVDAVFSGHLHRNIYNTYADTEYVISSAASMPLGDDPPGFRIIEVYSDHIEHEYYGYAEMPGSVDID